MPERTTRTQWSAHREDGLRRLSALTVGIALASAAATGVLVVAAQHATAGDSATGSGTSSGQDGLSGPDGVPLPDQAPPVGLSSGS